MIIERSNPSLQKTKDDRNLSKKEKSKETIKVTNDLALVEGQTDEKSKRRKNDRNLKIPAYLLLRTRLASFWLLHSQLLLLPDVFPSL